MEKTSEDDLYASQAIFNLLQEISKIPPPAHSNDADSNPASTWLDEVSRNDPAILEKEEKEVHLCETSNISCQDNVPLGFPCRMVIGESQNKKAQHSDERQWETNSAWDALEQIDCTCEMLRHREEEEIHPTTGTSRWELQPADVSEHALLETNISGEHSHTELPLHSNETQDQTLDHNANILPTEVLSETKLSPLSSVIPPSQPATPQFTTAESFHLPSEPTAAPASEHNTQQEELDLPSNCVRPSTRFRRQNCPCRSGCCDDPTFQGVTFRMKSVVDETREQCRLQITSKYRNLGPLTRKRRQEEQTSKKSLKTKKSKKENDLTANILNKECASCHTRKTPLWRLGDNGTLLCNACGIRYNKYKIRCVKCWHIPLKQGGSSCPKCEKPMKSSPARR